ncbi:synaptonemal complex protein 1-like [Mercenaria mercenaria]|uniref:synaptonemal complex protein 1-like n=1 Tax=Mercenaria mercenaria TaxID=6596 RepID=UPI00234E971E|nr:synaptonemal complex protein 1-like [Mercenaria mercenaria]
MPPKAKTIGQKSGKNAKQKSGGMLKSEDKLERSVAPSSTLDPAKQSVNKELLQREKKELISSFQEQLDLKQSENEKEIRKTLGQIKYLRRENERMQRKQMAEYGMTLDMMEELKETLEATKVNNDKRHEDMVEAKILHDKLEIELEETKQKFSDAVQKLNDLQKETKVWETTKEDFLKAEARCSELRKNNKKLRIILLKHHIDPCTDPRELSRDNQSDKQSYKTTRSYPDTPKRKLTVRSRYQSVGDVDMMKQMNELDLKRGMGVMAGTFDQVSPAYLGFYMKKREARRADYIRPGVSLPRIIYGK